MHDDEATNCIVTTIRVNESDGPVDAEQMAAAILDALTREGLRVVRTSDYA